jgi:MFS transporter, PAT family, beta-lactamase induction signal transducer AmpG
MGRAGSAGFAIYRDRRILAIALLGFSSGLPLLLTLSTLSIWLAESGVTKTAIGLFGLVGLPYTLKFLWAPVIDRARLPWLTARLGRRRGWMLAIQVALALAILALAATDPAVNPYATALVVLLVAFASASQDIVIDAYRIEVLDLPMQGAGAAATQFGYRIGLLASGAGALYIASYSGWTLAFASMAALVGVGAATTLASREPPAGAKETPAQTGDALADWIRRAVVDPFAEFLTRPGWLAILIFVLLYKFGDAFAGVMANPFYLEMGFTKIEIANVSKLFGPAATLAGVFLGGVVVARLGIVRALLICGVLQMLSNLMFAIQAVVGHSVPVLFLTIGIENLSGGMGSAAFVAYLSALCNLAYTATQYALLSSLTAFGRTVLSSGSGWLADHVDWVSFFLVSTVLAGPGLLVLVWMMRRLPAAGLAHAGGAPAR